MRLIDESVALKKLNYILKTYRMDSIAEKMRDALKRCPTIDTASLRPKGKWIGEADGYADGELVYDVWNCSECNHCIDDGTDDPNMLPNFCPNCGADMRGGEGDG